jgi:hypothetical protein
MRKQAARDEERRTLDSDKKKAPESSAEVRGPRRTPADRTRKHTTTGRHVGEKERH